MLCDKICESNLLFDEIIGLYCLCNISACINKVPMSVLLKIEQGSLVISVRAGRKLQDEDWFLQKKNQLKNIHTCVG